MNIKIICVGKLKEEYWRGAEAEYRKRLRAYANIEVIEVRESRTDDIVEEGEHILKRLGFSQKSNKARDGVNLPYVITLEINGDAKSSEELAQSMEDLATSGNSDVVFIIGGSCGLAPTVVDLADMRLSFSKMTFPHQMMRVILLEQIYRSFKIIRHEKYHK